MTGARRRTLVRQWHRGLGAFVALFVVVVAISGIALQHPDWLGEVASEPMSVAVDPLDSSHLMQGTHWGVEVSNDGGLHWREVAMLTPPTDVRRLLFGPVAGQIYAMGATSLVMSSDGGHIWQDVPGPQSEKVWTAQFLDLTCQADGGLALLTSVGLYCREAGGGWSLVGSPLVKQSSLGQWVHDVHTGHVFGRVGRRIAEAGAWMMLLLTASGLVLYRRVRKRKQS